MKRPLQNIKKTINVFPEILLVVLYLEISIFDFQHLVIQVHSRSIYTF